MGLAARLRDRHAPRCRRALDPWDAHYHLDLRFLVVASGEPAPERAEVHAAEWLAWDDAVVRTGEPALRRALAKARAAAG